MMCAARRGDENPNKARVSPPKNMLQYAHTRLPPDAKPKFPFDTSLYDHNTPKDINHT